MKCIYCDNEAVPVEVPNTEGKYLGPVIACEECVMRAIAKMIVCQHGDTEGVKSHDFPSHEGRIQGHIHRIRSNPEWDLDTRGGGGSARFYMYRRLPDSVKRQARLSYTLGYWRKLYEQIPRHKQTYVTVRNFRKAMIAEHERRAL